MPELLPGIENRAVLRRVPKSQYDPSRDPPIMRGAFNPGPADTDGLSVYLEGHLGCTEAELAASGRKPGEYFIVRFTVAELHALGISVLSTPELDPDLPGHCSVPELSVSRKDQEPQMVKELQMRLTSLSATRIVLAPNE